MANATATEPPSKAETDWTLPGMLSSLCWLAVALAADRYVEPRQEDLGIALAIAGFIGLLGGTLMHLFTSFGLSISGSRLTRAVSARIHLRVGMLGLGAGLAYLAFVTAAALLDPLLLPGAP